MVAVVAVVDQTFPVDELEVKSTEPPVQKEVGPFAEIIGVAGNAFTVTVTMTRGPSYPAAFI